MSVIIASEYPLTTKCKALKAMKTANNSSVDNDLDFTGATFVFAKII